MKGSRSPAQVIPLLSGRWRTWNLSLLLLYLALVLGTVLFTRHRHQARVRSELKVQAARTALGIEDTLTDALESFRGLSSNLALLPDLTLNDFTRLGEQEVKLQQGMVAVEWQPLVPEAQRVLFEQQARRQGGVLRGFSLWEPDAAGRPVPAAPRPVHVPVYYMLAPSVATSTLGLDLAFSPERMISKWQAAEQGKPVSSGLFRVVVARGASDGPIGFAVTMPVYNRGLVPRESASRRQSLRGFLAVVYSLQGLFTAHLKELQRQGVNVAIYETGNRSPQLYLQAGPSTAIPERIETTIYGNPWTIELSPTDRFLKPGVLDIRVVLPLVAASVGGMLLACLWTQQRAKEDLEQAHEQLKASLEHLRESESRLRELSRQDPLTGLLNRRAFEEALEQELGRLERYGHPLALLMLDLDHFKEINDRWGHPTGDGVLVDCARIFRTTGRNTDPVARLGGEEFAILLSHARLEEALVFAERLRHLIADQVFSVRKEAADPLGGTVPGAGFSITVSIGCALARPGITASALMAEADQALYGAKRNGRNRLEVFGVQGTRT